MRDDFSQKTKIELSQRVAYHCSNPECRRHTVGPKAKIDGTVSIGVAAHIGAAAPGGPRYAPLQTAEQRRHSSNGIWLCQSCSKLIDSDETYYSVSLLYEWKEAAEKQARIELARGTNSLDPASNFEGAISAPATSGFLSAVVLTQLQELQRAVAGEMAKQVTAAVDRLRSGDGSAVEGELKALRTDDARWTALEPAVQAKVLRLLASCRLGHEDVGSAERLAEEADGLGVPNDEPRLRALIAYRRQGPEAALSVLGAPASLDGANLGFGFLIELGDFSAAHRMLDTHPALAQPNAETWRLRAYLALEQNDRQGAMEAVRHAEELASHWPAVQEAGGIVRFALAVSRAVPPAALRAPNSIDLDLVREDEEARRALDEAAQCFACSLEKEQDDGARRILETWRLAVLACQHHRLDEAAAYARDLLRRDRTHWGAIAWSLARGFDLDRAGTLRALGDLLDAKRGDASHLAVVLLLQLDRGQSRKALLLLERHAPRFREEDTGFIEHWRARLEAEVHGGGAGPLPYRLARALEEARRSSDWTSVSALLATLVDDPASLPLILPACQSLASAHRWTEIRPFIPSLAERIATAQALQLAAFAAFRTGDPAKALELIDAYAQASGDTALPIDLRRLKADAKRAAGDVAGALRDIQVLSLENGEPIDLIRQAQFGAQIGDLGLIFQALNQPTVLSALRPEHAVHWAGLVASHDPQIARTLLKHAVDRGLPDAAIPAALTQSLHLASEEITQRLMPEMARLSSEDAGGRVRTLTIDDLPDFIGQLRQNSQWLGNLYANGTVAPHLVAQWMDHRFASLFSRRGEDNGGTAFRREQAPLFIRFGGRPAVTLPERDILSEGLSIDVSALLLADAIGLLDLLDEDRVPLRLPHMLPQALLQLETRAAECQPDRVAAMDDLQRTVASGRVLVIESDDQVSMVERPIIRVVHNEENEDPAIEPEGVPLVSVRAIADALLDAGRLDADWHADSVRRMGSDAAQPSKTRPHLGDVLVFEYNTIETLTIAGLLEHTTANFDVRVERRYLDDCAAERASLDERRNLADRLRQVRERSAKRLADGRWRFLSRQPNPDDEMEGAEELHTISGPEWCLRELMRIPSDEPAILWIDDRWASRYAEAQGHPIIGITDVLAALRNAGRLDDRRYFEFLLRLRRARAHFILPTVEEILHHLRTAPISEHGIIETPPLRTLRQAVADVLLLEEHWSLPDASATPNQHGELRLALDMFRLAKEVLTATWSLPDLDRAVRIAWSDWAWTALRACRFDRVPLGGDASVARAFYGQMLGFLVMSPVGLFELREGPGRQRCSDFMAWIENRVLTPALGADPDLDCQIASVVTSVLLNNERPHIGVSRKKKDPYWNAVLGGFVGILPEPVQQRLYDDAKLVEALGLTVSHTLALDNVSFDDEAFWSAVARARTGKRAAVVSMDDATRIELFRQPADSSGGVRFTGGIKGRLAPDPGLAVLDDDMPIRRLVLEDHPEWFDLPLAKRECAIESIMSAPTPAARMRLLIETRERSIPWRRQQWRQAIVARENIDFAPTPAPDLLRYLRFDTDTAEPSTVLTRAAETLLAELGPVETTRRLAGLPIMPTDAVVQAFAALPDQERHKALAELTAETAGPVGRLHVLALMRRLAHDGLPGEIDRLLADWERIGKAFFAIVRWTKALYTEDGEWRQLPGPSRLLLMWLHAHHVADTLMEARVQPDSIIQYFSVGQDRLRLDQQLVFDPRFDGSTLFPDAMVDPRALLFHGLAPVVGQEGTSLLSPEQRQRLEAMLCLPDGERLVPHPALLQDRRTLDDAFQSFFRDRPAGLFETAPDIGWEAVDRAKSAARTAFMADTPNADAVLLTHITGLHRDLAPQEMLAALTQLDIAAYIASSSSASGAVLRLAAEMAARSHDSAVADLFLAGLVDTARKCAARFRGPVEPPRAGADTERPESSAALLLLETLAALAKRPDLEAATAFLADGLHRLSDAWPAASSLWRYVARSVHDGLPFSVSAPIWRTWLRLRAAP